MGKLRFLKSRLQRLERDRGQLAIPQRNGSVYRTDRMRAWTDMFLYLSDTLHSIHGAEPMPELPEVMLAVVNAKDRRSALEMVFSNKDLLCFEEEALVKRGELVPRSMVVDADGRMYRVGEVVPDLSEPS